MTSARDNPQHGIRSGRNLVLVHKQLRANGYRGVEKPRQKSKRKYLPANRVFMLTPVGILSLPRLLHLPLSALFFILVAFFCRFLLPHLYWAYYSRGKDVSFNY